MKKFAFLLLFVVLARAAQPVSLYRIENPQKTQIDAIEKAGGQVSRFLPGSYAEVYLNDELQARFRNDGLSLTAIAGEQPKDVNEYYTWETITADLQTLANTYPELCQLSSLGPSVQGRDIWALKISDNVTIEEAEPEFKYVSTMHGDEVTGQELVMRLAHYLLENYGSLETVTDLVNSTEIWLVPNMNYDGTASGSRYNANGVDLNRNFPDREYGNPPYPGHSYPIQPETQHIIDFTAAHNFVMSANYHGGALVMNYPWDKKLPGDGGTGYYAMNPDDATFINNSLTYSMLNGPMYNSAWFTNGITNGAEWYEISGGMQDWNYFEHGCMEITIEVSENKWPSYSQIDQFWAENRESMIAYINRVHTGFNGFVTDSLTGEPLAATITVEEIGTPMYSDITHGDYYRVIVPGAYTVRFSAEGYFDRVFTNVVVTDPAATRLDARLRSSQTVACAGQVKNIETGAGVRNATLNFWSDGNLAHTAQTSRTGTFTMAVYPGDYWMTVEADWYFPYSDSVTISADTTVTIELQAVYPANISGTVRNEAGSPLPDALVLCQGISDSSDAAGNFRLEGIYPGDLHLFSWLPGYRVSRIDTLVGNGDSLAVDVMLEPGNAGYEEDFEQGGVFVAGGEWQHGTPQSGPGAAFSGDYAWGTNLNGNCSITSLSSLQTIEVAVLGLQQPMLSFHHWFDFEYSYDGANVKISTDDGRNWQIIEPLEGYQAVLNQSRENPLGGQPAFTGNSGGWVEAGFDLSAFAANGYVLLRFDAGNDNVNPSEGWFIDDLVLTDGNATVIADRKNRLPEENMLLSNYPNPFNPSTRIALMLPQSGTAQVRVYDLLGREVAEIFEGRLNSGRHEFKWNGTDRSGNSVSAGVYLLRAVNGTQSVTKKIVYLK
jgi:hypothetical protein